LKVNIQADYQQKGEDEDFIPAEPPSRTDYVKKALVNQILIFINLFRIEHRHWWQEIIIN
jgi:hypothetical protein